MAIDLGNVRLANVICLGAMVHLNGIVTLEAIEQALENHLPERHRKLLGMNKEALHKGAELAGA
jgi:2-oxoglutarate ferredoxin oxidoreductase subunit gamma